MGEKICPPKSGYPKMAAPHPNSANLKNIPKNCTVEKLPYRGEARCFYIGEAIGMFCEMSKKKTEK